MKARPALVVSDGLVGYLGTDMKSSNDAGVRRVLTPLAAVRPPERFARGRPRTPDGNRLRYNRAPTHPDGRDTPWPR